MSESEDRTVAAVERPQLHRRPVVQNDVGSTRTIRPGSLNCVHSNTTPCSRTAPRSTIPTGPAITRPTRSPRRTTSASRTSATTSCRPAPGPATSSPTWRSPAGCSRPTARTTSSCRRVRTPTSASPATSWSMSSYDNKGDADSIATARWEGPGPTLSDFTDIGVDNPNVDMTAAGYFAEVAIDLTALGLVPNVFDLATPDELPRVRVRTGDLPQQQRQRRPRGRRRAGRIDFNVCGTLVIQKEITAVVPGDTQFPVTVTAPTGVTLGRSQSGARGAGGEHGERPGHLRGAPTATPRGRRLQRVGGADRRPRPDDGILDSILCVNDKGTESTDRRRPRLRSPRPPTCSRSSPTRP